MTGMLASVKSLAEATTVLDESVDIIDLKQPDRGALGALSIDVVADIVDAIDGVIPGSATIGDVKPDDPALLEKISRMSATGIDIVKAGLFGTRPTKHFIDTLSRASAMDINLVVVLFAEDYIGADSYTALLPTGIKGIMLDTKYKTGKSLCEIVTGEVLGRFVNTVGRAGLLTGLAGSLRFDDIGQLLKLGPDYLGFRGALCAENNRVNRLDVCKIKKIRNAIPRGKKYRL